MISITEDPYPRENGDYSVSERKMIQIIRSNLKNAFQHLSKAYDTRKKNPITLLPLRKRPESSHDENIHEPEAAPSLLFWSLFDDWAATYSLIARKEYQYSGALDRMVRSSTYMFSILHSWIEFLLFEILTLRFRGCEC